MWRSNERYGPFPGQMPLQTPWAPPLRSEPSLVICIPETCRSLKLTCPIACRQTELWTGGGLGGQRCNPGGRYQGNKRCQAVGTHSGPGRRRTHFLPEAERVMERCGREAGDRGTGTKGRGSLGGRRRSKFKSDTNVPATVMAFTRHQVLTLRAATGVGHHTNFLRV